jgi:hypothetical protein
MVLELREMSKKWRFLNYWWLGTSHAYIFSVLVAPQTVIKSIRNLHQNFLWHDHKQGKKWALVGWHKICKPTSLGGLGLHDPANINNVMGEKIWWHWLKYSEELWA